MAIETNIMQSGYVLSLLRVIIGINFFLSRGAEALGLFAGWEATGRRRHFRLCFG